MTHADLCKTALKWLKRTGSAGGPGCAVAVSECRTGYTGEIPDAIGFKCTGQSHTDGSTVVEVKVSRSDFLADAKKSFRQGLSVGSWRYYMAPEGLIKPDELPRGWGLLEVNSRGHVKVRAGFAVSFGGNYFEMLRQAAIWRFPHIDLHREQFLLVRVLANTGDPQKVLYMLRESQNRASRLAMQVEKLQGQLDESRRARRAAA